MLSRTVHVQCKVAGQFTRTLATTTSASSSSQAEAPRRAKPTLKAAVVLSRAPILTRDQTAFEKAYFHYQQTLRRTLHNPFASDFYFKQGSPMETRFKKEERLRERAAFGKGYGKLDLKTQEGTKQLIAESELGLQEGENEIRAPRVHPADESGDLKNLNRRGQRNLYCLVASKEEGKVVWRFPQGGVEKGELLHQAAYRDLLEECGPNMDAWVVGKVPIGHHEPVLPSGSKAARAVTFFFKAHILAGQVSSDKVKDFAWLTKEEIRDKVDAKYWESIQDMLSTV